MRRMMCMAAALSVFGCGERDEPDDARWEVSPPLALLDVRVIDFAPTRVGAVASAVVRVTNAGDSPLRVESAEIEGTDEFELSPAPWVGVVELGAGESRALAVAYVPRDRGGDEGALVLETNATDAPMVRLPLSGEGTRPSPLVEAPLEVTLTPARALESSDTVFSIRNAGEAELLLEGLTVEAVQPGDLTIRYPDPDAPNDDSRDTSVASPGLNPGDSLLIRAVFAPERPGSYVFTMRWSTNDPTREELAIELSGQASEPEQTGPGNCPVADARASRVEDEDGRFESYLEAPAGSVVQLYGLASYSPLGVDVERYEWEIVERPEGSTVLLMPNPRTPTPRMFLDAPGSYRFTLSVFDAFGRESCERSEVEVVSIPAP